MGGDYTLGVLDYDQIVKDLLALQQIKFPDGERDLGRAAGFGYWRVNPLAKKKTKRRDIGVIFMDRWLRACGSSIAEYLVRHMTLAEIKANARDRELVVLIQRALKDPGRRETLSIFVRSMFPGER